MENGDMVLLNPYDYPDDKKDLMLLVGMIIRKLNNGEYLVVYNDSLAYRIKKVKNIMPIEEIDICRKRISDYYDDSINILRSQIRHPSEEDKDQEKSAKYENAKHRLLENCKRLLKSEDDEEILNRVKEISSLKKQLLNIEFDCASEIRKYNGTIKYEIRELEAGKAKDLGRLSDDVINRNFGQYLNNDWSKNQ